MTERARRRWPERLRRGLHGLAVGADERLDAAFRRADQRFGWNRPRHIAAYRGYADARVQPNGSLTQAEVDRWTAASK